MRVLIVMQHANLFRNLDTLVRELDLREHEIVILHGTRFDDPKVQRKITRKKARLIFLGRGIELAEATLDHVTTGYRPELPAHERWQRFLQTGREVVNRSIYLQKGHPSPPRGGSGHEHLPGWARLLLDTPLGRALLRRPAVLRLWRSVESISPASRTISTLLEELRPDVILVSPVVWPKAPVEASYILAARRLRIPTVGYMNSWDNLTSKGTVHVMPNVFVVWNDALAGEARDIHRIPQQIIEVAGAPHMDYFFSLRPSPRATICRRLGCPDDRPYVVYLCSSRTLIASEVDAVTALADELAGRLGVAAPTVVVRPHPVNPTPWDEYAHPGVVVYPGHGDQADTPEAWQEYYDQLAGACCCFGLNTTAFLEAAVADRPCLTVVSDEFFDQQGRTGHFRHLLAGDFLEVCEGMSEVAARVERVLAGVDEKAAGRRAFVEWFLRPRGIERPVAPQLADLVEELAGAPRRKRRRAEAVPVPARAAEERGR